MEKMLERAVLFAYRRAIALGADGVEAFETALDVVFDARPNIDDDDGRSIVAAMTDAAPDEASPSAAVTAPQSGNGPACTRATTARSSTNRRISRSRVA